MLGFPRARYHGLRRNGGVRGGSSPDSGEPLAAARCVDAVSASCAAPVTAIHVFSLLHDVDARDKPAQDGIIPSPPAHAYAPAAPPSARGSWPASSDPS